MRLALIIRLTIGKAYYENTFRVFHHSLITKSKLILIIFLAITLLFLEILVLANQILLQGSYRKYFLKQIDLLVGHIL